MSHLSGNTIAQQPSTSEDDDSGLAGLITQVKPPTEAELAAPTKKQKRPKIDVSPSAAARQLNPPQHSTLSFQSSSNRSGGRWRNFLNSFLSCCSMNQIREAEVEKSNELNARSVLHETGLALAKGKTGELLPQIEKSAVDTPMVQIPSPKLQLTSSRNPAPSPVSPKKYVPSTPERRWLLPPLDPRNIGKKCLVLDLDETLVHSSFKPVANADYVIPVEIDNQVHSVYVLKRPGVDTFLQRLGPQFEVVIFTASLAKYADPVLDILDQHKVVEHRLFRESCLHHKGNYVKDLSQLGRELKDVIIIDNSPASYIFHPTNAIPITSWFHDPNDTELLDLIPFLEDLKMVDNVMLVLDSSNDE